MAEFRGGGNQRQRRVVSRDDVESEGGRRSATVDEGRACRSVGRLELLPDPHRSPRCSGCGQVVEAIPEVEERWVRILPLLGTPVELLLQRCRLACPRCGPKLEHLDWLAPLHPGHAAVIVRPRQAVSAKEHPLPRRAGLLRKGIRWSVWPWVMHLLGQRRN